MLDNREEVGALHGRECQYSHAANNALLRKNQVTRLGFGPIEITLVDT